MRAEITAALRRGAWEAVRPGAYVAAISDPTSFAGRRTRALAHVAAVAAKTRGDYVLSHESASLLHGLPLVGPFDAVDLVQRFKPGAHDAADVRRHFFPLPPGHTVTRHGLPVTGLERTVVDCAMSLGRRAGLIIADAALHIGADLGLCEEILDGMRRRRGVVAARWVLSVTDGGSESPGETGMRCEMLLAGLPSPVTQVRVETRLGDFWADMGWPERRVLLEYDGVAKYEASGRASTAVLAEKRRQEALEDSGWTVVRAAAPDLRHPTTLLTQVHSALTRPLRPPPPTPPCAESVRIARGSDSGITDSRRIH